MKIIQSKDFIQIRLESIISSQDIEFLSELYGPLIGVEAVGLFLACKQYEGLLDQEPLLLEKWLTFIQSSPQQFHLARLQLEALGLLRTYQQSYQDTQLFTFSLFAPKSPLAFFQDPLLKGLLLQRIGPLALKRIETKYLRSVLPQEAKEISASFGEVFHPDFRDEAFGMNQYPNMQGKTFAEIRKPFDRLQFIEQLRIEFSLNHEKLAPQDLDAAVNIAMLVGLDELTMANLFGTFLGVDHRLQLPQLEQAARKEKRLPSFRPRPQVKQQFQSTTPQAMLINQMELMSPVEFLSSRQKGAEVSPADFSLLLRLQQQYHLTNPVINALIYQVLTTQNNVLSSRYVEKVAATLTRETLHHASDALDYFLKISQPRFPSSKSPATKPGTSQMGSDQPQDATPSNATVDEEELTQLESKLKGLK